jgi:hypothetical protein
MSTLRIEVAELQNFDSESVKYLTEFLEKRLDVTVSETKNELALDFEEGKILSKSNLRLLLRKFLHKQELKADFRVISGGEDSFIIKEKKVYVD